MQVGPNHVRAQVTWFPEGRKAGERNALLHARRATFTYTGPLKSLHHFVTRSKSWISNLLISDSERFAAIEAAKLVGLELQERNERIMNRRTWLLFLTAILAVAGVLGIANA